MKTLLALVVLALQLNAHAIEENLQGNILDELDPSAPDIEEKLQEMDEAYYKMTGEYPFLKSASEDKYVCYRNACQVWARINLSEQLMYIYIDGEMKHVWLTSTGARGYRTPYLDEHPNGRIYDRYTSSAYPRRRL